MTGLNLGQNILSVGAAADVGDVGGVEAQASVDFLGTAQLKRGIRLELGVSAMGEIEASFAKYLAADAEVRGQARAQLRGQVQAPIDLFSEAGVAVRLQAIAQLSLSARLAIGLSVGDFIALAQQDPRIRGVYLRLLEIFLEEINVQAGVQGRVAYSAMAYLNLVLSGRLVEDEANGLPAGFTIAANCGAGLKGGGGWGLFAQLGFKSPRRFVRRSVDVMVDETVLRLQRSVDRAEVRETMKLLRAPAKMALRGGFELGLALAENSSALSNAGPQLAQRCTQVVLEEAQRLLLEQLTELAIALIREGLDEIGAGAAAWDAAEDERAFLQSQLGDMPDDPLEPTVENFDYWLGVINGAVTLGVELSGNLLPDELRRATGLLWSSLQLLFVATQRVSDASVRASFFGSLSAEARIEAFEGQVIDQAPAPQALSSYINGQLGRGSDEELRQEHLVTFLTGEAIDELIDRYPSTRALLEIVAGANASPAALSAAASVVLDNAGAFVPLPSGDGSEMDPEASLRALSEGLQAYINTRVKLEVVPEIYAAVGDNSDLRLYVDEVLLPSMDFIVDTAFDAVLDWSFGNLSASDALREACSSIVMKVLGRSLVVTTDVLMTHASRAATTELRSLAEEVDDPGGFGEQLADAANADRELVGEALRESLLICADVFGPLPDERRAKIRNLLYLIVDSVPPDPDADWVDQLQRDAFIPDAATREALLDLGNELGTTLADFMQQFYLRVLQRVGEIALEEIQELGKALAEDVAAFVAQVRGLLNVLQTRLAQLPALIAAQLELVAEALAEVVEATRQMLLGLPEALETRLKALLSTALYEQFIGTLLGSAQYAVLPTAAAEAAREALIEGCELIASEALFDPMASRLGELAEQGVEGIVEDIQAALEDATADGDVDIAATVRSALLERLDALIDEVFGAVTPQLSLDLSFSYTTPAVGFVGTPAYLPPQTISVYIPLGSVNLPLADIGAALREALANLSLVEQWLSALTGDFLRALAAREEHLALSLEQDLTREQTLRVEELLAGFEGEPTSPTVLSPLPGAVFEAAVPVDLHIRNATPAFLGLEQTVQPRILVLLNQTPIANDRFSATLVDGDEAPQVDARDLALSLTGTASARRVTQGLHGQGLIDRFAAGVSAGEARGASRQGRDRLTSASKGLDREAPTRRRRDGDDCCGPDAGARRRRSARRGAGSAQTRSRKGAAIAGGGFGRQPLHLIGNAGKRSERDDDAQSLGSGLRLTLQLPGGECRSGINTLALLVSDGFGRTQERVVSFVFAAADTDRDRDREATLKGRPPWALTRLPEALVDWMNLDKDLQEAARRRGAAGKAASAGETAPPDREASDDESDAFWIDRPSRRQKTLLLARDTARREATQRQGQWEAVARGVAAGGLKPESRKEAERPPQPSGRPAERPSRERPQRLPPDQEKRS